MKRINTTKMLAALSLLVQFRAGWKFASEIVQSARSTVWRWDQHRKPGRRTGKQRYSPTGYSNPFDTPVWRNKQPQEAARRVRQGRVDTRSVSL